MRRFVKAHSTLKSGSRKYHKSFTAHTGFVFSSVG
ncbi:hypothetical protein Gogos_005958 [Gossypium gossypioides]|uniref:Uncharacterized protein n=1 Tax=Gossypium gossypioides TaxID=34282 RepID=A0A7J9C446_GOSGO|nr:hypothetical protein [Gossypium gossypioides]